MIILGSSGLFSQDFIQAFKVGGFDHDDASDCFQDSQGNYYLSGSFQETVDFDPGSGEALLTALNSLDAFLVKYDESLNYTWAIAITGNDQVNGKKIVVDENGNTYIAGYFRGTADFDPSAGEYMIEAEDMDGFLAKYDANGNLVWAFKLGSPESDIAYDVCLDNTGNVWVSGKFNAPLDFDPSGNEFILSDHGLQDAFIAKYQASGDFIWAGSIGGEATLFYQPILAADNSGNIYYAGHFPEEVDLDPGQGTFMASSNGYADIFLMCLDNAGNLSWAFTIGGAEYDYARDVIVDNGKVMITGFYESTSIDFDPSSGEDLHTSEGDADSYLATYQTDGSFLWAISIESINPSNALALANDDDHNIYLSGEFYGTSDFDPSSETYELTAQGLWDVFTVKYDDGGNLQWANYAGGNDNDIGYGILVSNDQETVMVCGKFMGWAEFDNVGPGQILSASGGFDAFVVEYTSYSGAGIHDENSGLEDVRIYPNPASGRVFIDIPAADKGMAYSIINSLGMQMVSRASLESVMEIDISGFSPGNYFVKIEKGKRARVFKMIVE